MKTVHKYSGGSEFYAIFCPACKCTHRFTVASDKPGKAKWTFNGDLDKPTFNPSMVETCEGWVDPDDKGFSIPSRRCHSWVRGGRIEFLSDCTHEFAGRTVDLPHIPKEWE